MNGNAPRVIGAAICSAGLVACAGDGGSANPAPSPDSGAPAAPAYERLACDLPAVVEFCGGGACHYDNSAQDVASSLALWDRQAGRIAADVEARLVNGRASYHNVPDPENCPTEPELYIDPLDVERSLVLRKLGGMQQCGVEMPKFPYPEWGTVQFPGPQREMLVQCIRDWVLLLVEDYNQTQ